MATKKFKALILPFKEGGKHYVLDFNGELFEVNGFKFFVGKFAKYNQEKDSWYQSRTNDYEAREYSTGACVPGTLRSDKELSMELTKKFVEQYAKEEIQAELDKTIAKYGVQNV